MDDEANRKLLRLKAELIESGVPAAEAVVVEGCSKEPDCSAEAHSDGCVADGIEQAWQARPPGRWLGRGKGPTS